jgi:hypothetical protein
MQVTFSSASSSAKGTNSAATIARLEKQMRELTEQLKAAVWEDLDPKVKEQKIQMLQAMIQMVQQQIAAIQQADAMQQMQRQQAKAAEQQKASEEARQNQSNSRPRLVDAYA